MEKVELSLQSLAAPTSTKAYVIGCPVSALFTGLEKYGADNRGDYYFTNSLCKAGAGGEGGGGGARVFLFIGLLRTEDPQINLVSLKHIGVPVGSSYPSYREAYE